MCSANWESGQFCGSFGSKYNCCFGQVQEQYGSPRYKRLNTLENDSMAVCSLNIQIPASFEWAGAQTYYFQKPYKSTAELCSK